MKPALASINHRKQIESLMDRLGRKQINLVEKTCSLRIKKLLQKQLHEVSEFRSQWEAEKVKLKKTHELDLDLIQSIPMDSAAKKETMESLHEKLSKKLNAFEGHMKCQRRKLIVKQLNARSREKSLQDQWLEEAKAGRLTETFDRFPLCDTGFCLEQFTFNEIAASGPKLLICSPLGQHCANTTAAASTECIDMCTICSESPVSFTSENAKDMPVESGPPFTHFHMSGTESVGSFRTSAENQAISTDEILHNTPLESGTLHSSYNLRNAAACNLGVVLTDLKVTSGVEVPLENKGNSSLLSSTHVTAKELDAIKPILRAAVGFDPIETDIQLPTSNIVTTSVTETDPMVNNLQTTCGVDMPLQTKIAPYSLNVAANKVDTVMDNFEVLGKVDKELDTAVTNPEAAATADMHLEPETLSSPSPNELDAIDNNLEAMTELDSQQYQCTISDSACLRSSSQQSPIQFPSSAHILSVTELGRAITSNQALNTSKQEIAGSSGLATKQVSGSPLSSGFLASSSIASEPLQLQSTNHNSVTSDCNQLHSPLSNATESAEDGQVSRPVRPTWQTESSGQSSFSTQQTEVPSEQLAVLKPAQVESPNQLGVQLPVQSVALGAADITSESSRTDDYATTSMSSTSGSFLSGFFPLPQFIHLGCSHPDPFENELIKLSKNKEIHLQMHEDKKRRIRLEYEKEIQAIKRKFDALIQDIDAKYVQGKKMFQTMYDRLNNNSDLAQQFRDKFIDNKGGASVAFHGIPFQDLHSRQQFYQVLQQQSTLNSALTSNSVPAPASAPVPTTFHPAVASSPQSLMSLPVRAVHPSAFPSNSVISDFNFTLPSHANLQVRRQLRAPAPHLRPLGHRSSVSASGVGLRPCTLITQQQSNNDAGSASSLNPLSTASLTTYPTRAPPSNTSRAAANMHADV